MPRCNSCGAEQPTISLQTKEIPVENSPVPVERVTEYRGEHRTTIFLSKLLRAPMLEEVTEERIKLAYDRYILPWVNKLVEMQVNFVGHLAKPAYVNLAVTDLTKPFAIFEFITIDHPNQTDVEFRADLLSQGFYSGVFVEGLVDTVSAPSGSDSGALSWFNLRDAERI